MSRLLYMDCIAGIAGDMLLGALLDAGADSTKVTEGLSGLGIEGLELRVTSARRHSIVGRRTTVVAPRDQPHRHWASIRDQIDRAEFGHGVRCRAQDAFRRLALAEARIHGVSPDSVQFHEVGAVDAIAEICGVAIALEQLEIDHVVCSPLPIGRGFTTAVHGQLPLPAPAALAMLEGVPLHGVDVDVELVTPTGAALVASLADRYGPMPPLTLESIGYGAGSRDLEQMPNVLRVVIGAKTDATPRAASLIEANLDDMLPELVPNALAACVAAGALDAWTAPAQMKHGRPGFIISAIARRDRERAVAEAMLRETSTIGVRLIHLDRIETVHDTRSVDIDGVAVRIKVARLDGRVVNVAPEHADCAEAARITGAPLKTMWARAMAAAQDV
jgi:pyridinium-3,5-bisthiocarboxylic acid mononucleotide nickel chelatase